MKSEPEELATEFLAEYRNAGLYLRDDIARLAELSVNGDERVADAATRCIFGALVEPLSDSFEPSAVSLYNRVFARIVQVCRLTERGAGLDHELASFGLRNEGDLIARADSLRRVGPLEPGEALAVKRVLVLSRVTLGANVAISSIIIERMKGLFPDADIFLLGGRKVAELFGGDRRLKFREVNYGRGGTTLDRVLSWLDLVSCVRELTRHLAPAKYLVVDPDSRLTQLGLLPVTTRENYLFFPSREFGYDADASLAKLTSVWLDEMFGAAGQTYPVVSLHGRDLEAARALIVRIRRCDDRPILSINFGVGENPSKRVGSQFEKSLIKRLIETGFRIVLDKGDGPDEENRVAEVIGHLHSARVLNVDEPALPGLLLEDRIDADLITWSGRIGLLAALIGESDLYIGYDSAGQHIAAALEVPCIDVFAGFSSRRMLDRWHPAGKANSRVVVVEAGPPDPTAIQERVMRIVHELLGPQDQ